MSSSDFVQRGQALVAKGQYQEAVKVCRLGLLAHPTAIDGRLVLGSALMALRRYDEVLAEMRVALELDASSSEALALKGEALLRKGDSYQAADVLSHARTIDPTSGRVRALSEEADMSVAASGGQSHDTGGGYGEIGDSMTKHYPAHLGAAMQSSTGSANVTRPTAALRNRADERFPKRTTPSPHELAVGDKSGTIEIDPDVEGVEMIDELDDPPIDPPLPSGDSDVIELDAADLLEDSGVQDMPHEDIGVSRPVPDTFEEPTAHYRPGQPMARPRGKPADYNAGTGVGTVPESPRARPRRPSGAPSDPVLERTAAKIDELFPDDESGVSSLEVLREGDLPQPSILSGAMDPDLAGRRSPSEDMRTIRAGLGLDSRGDRGRRAVGKPRSRADDPTANVIAPAKRGRVHERDVSTGVAVIPDDDVKTKRKHKQQPKKKKKKVSPTKRGGQRKQSRAIFYVLLALALPVIGGGVYLGFKIRELRLDRRIAAVERDAAALEKKDTYGVYLRARDEYQRIVDARSSSETRSALARMQAAIAAEFGEELEEADEAVEALGDADNVDAAVARAYLAIARADSDAADKEVAHIEKVYPDEPFAGYLRGRVTMLSGDARAAAAQFRTALGPTQQRPVVYIRLGEAEVAAKELNEAKFRFAHVMEVVPGHPAAIIARARLMSKGELPAEGDPENALEGLIAEGRKALSEQELGVAPRQIAWANLALAEVKLAREKLEDAKAALSSAQEARPRNDLEFSESLIEILLRVGQMKAAEDEARHAVSKWPERIGPRVVLAQVALERDRPQEVIEALKDVEDLSEYPQALAVRGRAHLALGDLKAAKADLDAALTVRPDHPDALLARAEVDLREGQTAAVVKRLKDMYNDSADPALGIIYAAALRREGERGKARGILQMLITLPDSGKAHLELARLERDEGNYKAARAAYSEAIKKLPGGVDARLEAAILALDTGDVSGAKETMVKLVDDFGDSGRVLVEAARIYAMTGALDDANKLLDKAQDISSAPRWRIARERGRVHLRRREANAAVTELSRAVSLKSDDGETRLLLIDAHLASENSGAARSTKDDVLNRRESFEGLWVSQMAVGRWNLYNDLLDEALKAFSEAKKILDKNQASPRLMADAHYWIGRVHYYDDKLAASQKQLEKAVQLNPAHFDAHLFLGLVHYDAKRWRTAAKSFQASVDIQPESNPATFFYMGECWYNAKNWRASKNAFKQYVKLDPKGDLVREAKVYIRKMGG